MYINEPLILDYYPSVYFQMCPNPAVAGVARFLHYPTGSPNSVPVYPYAHGISRKKRPAGSRKVLYTYRY